jgi:hypothetical protein
MSNNCPPLRLPIQIQTSCAPNNDCSCESNPTSCYESDLCSINTSVVNQETYQNNCYKIVDQTPILEIAYLSNVRNICNSDLTVILNPICLNWCDFLLLFYQTNGVFFVSPSNLFSCATSFHAQTYENTTNKCIKFNLAQQVRLAWSTRCETSVDNIPPKTNLLLNKDAFYIRSLLNSTSTVALTLDQAISTLLSSGEIAPGDSTTSALVKFVVNYKYCFQPLNVCVTVKFTYATKIPCYKNVNQCDDWCPPYSSDSGCRSCLDTRDEVNEVAKFMNNIKQVFPPEKGNVDFDITSNNGDGDSIQDATNNDMDAKTFITTESSTW